MGVAVQGCSAAGFLVNVLEVCGEFELAGLFLHGFCDGEIEADAERDDECGADGPGVNKGVWDFFGFCAAASAVGGVADADKGQQDDCGKERDEEGEVKWPHHLSEHGAHHAAHGSCHDSFKDAHMAAEFAERDAEGKAGK